MPVTVEWNNLPIAEGIIRSELGKVVAKAALSIEATAKASMTEPKSGRVYRRGKKTHQASAAGQAPAIDTGALANSIQADTTEADAKLYAEVGAGTEYAEPLEMGTARIAPRPFMTPAAEAERPKLQQAAESAVKRAAQKVTR